MSKKNADPNAPVPRLTVDLAGQVALVTGASRGIGRAIAEALGAAGPAWLAWRGMQKSSRKRSRRLKPRGEMPTLCRAMSPMAKRCKNWSIRSPTAGAGLDILVNNAGVTRDTLLPRMSDEQWDEVLDTNLRGVFLFTRAATRPMMQARYGRIINISSVSGLRGNPGQANYSASKAAVIGFTRTVARELASRKITVNVVAPGFIDTEMTAALGPVMLEEITKRMIPAKRMGQVDEVADAVLYFASPASGYVTGQVLVVDGGFAV